MIGRKDLEMYSKEMLIERVLELDLDLDNARTSLKALSSLSESEADDLIGAAQEVLDTVAAVLPKGYEDPDEPIELYNFRRGIDDLRDALGKVEAT